MSSVNRVILVGRCTADMTVRFTQNNTKIVSFSLATNETWKDKQTGERKEKVEYHRVVIFNEHLAGIAEQYLRKGSQCYIEGQLQSSRWTDQSGTEKTTTEVVLQRYRGDIQLLDAKPREERAEAAGNYKAQAQADHQAPLGGGGETARSADEQRQNELDDDIDPIPFITPWGMW